MEDETNGLSNALEYIPREFWGAAEPLTDSFKEINMPIENIVTSWTETDACFTREECITRVKAIQAEHMKKGLPDIEYNFLVGSDGYLYEGRGWRWQGPEYPTTSKFQKKLAGNSIEVAFIDKSCNDATEGITRALGNLISLGYEIEFLNEKINFFSRTDNDISFIHTHDTNEEKHYPQNKEQTRRTNRPNKHTEAKQSGDEFT